MKRTGCCPKCKGCDIIEVQVAWQETILQRTYLMRTSWSRLDDVYMRRLVCMQCGYSEKMLGAEDIEAVKGIYPPYYANWEADR